MDGASNPHSTLRAKVINISVFSLVGIFPVAPLAQEQTDSAAIRAAEAPP